MLIRKEDRKLLKKIVQQTITTPCEVIAYGSRVDGTAHDASDLDLVIRCKENRSLDIDEFISLKDAVQNSNIPILVQIFDWGRIPESFKFGILDNNEVLVEVE